MLGLHRLKGLHPWAIVTHYSGVALLFVLAAWIIGGVPDLVPLANAKTILLLVATGLAATVGQVCFTKAFTSGQPARVSVVGLMQIVFALGLDVVFEGPHFHAITLAGIALVLAPTAWMMAGRQAPPPHDRGRNLEAEQPLSLKSVPVAGK
jgi:drug/metabolite transporter (DMT)-like permease